MAGDALSQAAAILRRDALRNIVPLKMLRSYGHVIECYVERSASGDGVLLLLPVACSAWDRAHYPGLQTVALMVAPGRPIAEKLLERVPSAGGVVFKLAGEVERACVLAHCAARRTTAFVSYTSAPGRPFAAHAGVCLAAALRPGMAGLFAAEGHDAAELAEAAARGDALLLAGERDGELLAACFAQRIYEHIWEVGGLHTLPRARRQGLARGLVETALAELGRRGLTPRYQVREDNDASRQLAEAAGLQPFVTVEHFVCERAAGR